MPAIQMYTKSWCPYCERAKALLREKGQSWTEIDVEQDDARRVEMVRRSGRTTVPQIWIGDRHVGGFDDLAALERAGELDPLLSDGHVRRASAAARERVRLVIVGSGPAGYTAAIYAARAELAPVLLAGLQFGGQLMLTTDVENYPGFPEAVSGPELMERFQRQAERFGTRVLFEDATLVDLSQRPFVVETADRSLLADAVIVATGASAKWLGLPSEKRLYNKGVSACATCDGALYRGKSIAVVGGGDSAMEEAIFLTRFATKVTVIHRRGELRASKIMQQRATENPKIAWRWHTVVSELLETNGKLSAVRLREVNTGKEDVLAPSGLFVAIGHVPNTWLFEGQLPIDATGYLEVEGCSTRTAVPGVFACGDCVDHVYRQAVTAAGTGCMAAIDAERYLTN